MFFMCFWHFILLCHTSQFLLFEGFALLHWCYFLLHLKTDIKGPLLFLLKKLTYPLQTIFESLFWMYLLHLLLTPPLLTSHWTFPTDVNASMKQVKITVKNLLRYFLHYFLLHLKTDIKGPLLFLLKKLTYPLQTIFESLFWMYLLHLLLTPPLLTSHWTFPTDVNASMKQVKITVKNLLRYLLYSAIILWRERDCIFSRDGEGEAGCCMATSYWLHVKVWGSQFRLEVTNTLLTPDKKTK